MEIVLKTPSQIDSTPFEEYLIKNFLFFRFVSYEKHNPHLSHITVH